MKVDIYNTNKKYKVIYADPPWSFKSKNTGGYMKSGSAAHYNVMGINDIKAMPVTEIADDDCILIMWWVGSQPQEALDLVKAWGFEVKNMNGFVWNKQTVKGNPHFGMGYYTRAGSESAIIAIKGKPQIESRSVRAVRSAKVGKHSEKPAEFRDDIVQMLGDIPRIELFARKDADGWDCFGDEI